MNYFVAAALPAAFFVAGCGGTPIQTLQLGNLPALNFVQASASSGFAKTTDDITDIANNTTFSTKALIAFADSAGLYGDFETQDVTVTVISPSQIQLKVDGETYLANWDPDTEEFFGTNGNVNVSAELLDLGAVWGDVGYLTLDGPTWGSGPAIIGYNTAPSTLSNIASATYSGDAVVAIDGIDSSLNSVLDLAAGTFTLHADFTGNAVSGNITVSDPLGDSGSPTYDIGNGVMTITQGNFDSDGINAQLDYGSGTLANIDLEPGTLHGGIFGPDADEVIAVFGSNDITTSGAVGIQGLISGIRD